MSKENEETIAAYKDKIHIVVTPKKGGTGLNEALEGMCVLAKAMVEKAVKQKRQPGIVSNRHSAGVRKKQRPACQCMQGG